MSPMRGESEFKNEFSWSKSRDVLFRKCQRAYYYHYYGCWGGWLPDSPSEVKELYIMKNLETTAMWSGRVVHAVLEEIVRAISRGSEWPIDAAVRMARQRAQHDFEDSRSGAYRSWPRRLCGLQDHYYGVFITDESLEEAIATMEGCIRRLYSTRTYSKVLELGPEMIMEFEELHSITLSGYKVWVKPDLVGRDLDDSMVVVDWKTGLGSAREESKLQLGIYGIYAVRAYGLPPEGHVGIEANLRSAEEHRYPLTADLVQDVLRYIKNSADRMHALLSDPAENLALIEDFPQVDNLELCQGCQFRRACNRG